MRARTLVTAGASLIGLGLAVVLSAQAADWKAHPGANFPLVGGNWWNQRHSTLTKINKSTLSQLGGAWMVHVEPGKVGLWMQATPVVVDGIMYITTGHISARDARTGELKWQFPKGTLPGACSSRAEAPERGLPGRAHAKSVCRRSRNLVALPNEPELNKVPNCEC
jgi:hypothetical protein